MSPEHFARMRGLQAAYTSSNSRVLDHPDIARQLAAGYQRLQPGRIGDLKADPLRNRENDGSPQPKGMQAAEFADDHVAAFVEPFLGLPGKIKRNYLADSPMLRITVKK